MVDAANACVFVRARDLGLTGRELPEELERDAALLERLQVIRRQASVAMGIARDDAEARDDRGGADHRLRRAADGCADPVGRADRRGAGRSDGAVPLERPAASGAAADRLAVHRGRGEHRRERWWRRRWRREPGAQVRIGMPSGILTVGADVGQDGGPVGGAQRRVLSHRAAAVRRPDLRSALNLDFSNERGASGLRMLEKCCARTVFSKIQDGPDADRV